MILRRRAFSPCTLAIYASLCAAASTADAATLSFEATTAFPVIDAGEVPYYSEAPGRSSLAINAAKVEYRDKFARASMVFEGPSGLFDITLTTLAELDGEAPYRVLINDVLIGSATNPEVTVDYTPVRHTFEDIVVPEGATIAVESLANTNGKIPEGEGTAFARGRWTTLELNNDDAGTQPEDTIDLSVSSNTDTRPVMVGESRILTFDISNAADSAVATQPTLKLKHTRTDVSIDTESLENCANSGNDIVCSFSEIPAEGSEQLSITLTGLEPATSTLVSVAVSADQTDSDTTNNSITLPFQIEEAPATSESPAPETENQDNNGADPNVPDTTDGETTSGRSSGGGALGALSLILLATVRLRCRC